MEGTPLEHADTFKYRGVILSSDLFWTPQVESVCTKARKLLGLLYRLSNNNTGANTLLEPYTTLVRPHLENAAPVWDPSTANNINNSSWKTCTQKWLSGLTICHILQNCCLYLNMCTLLIGSSLGCTFCISTLPLCVTLATGINLL